jgi:preprotein translocase subunit Sec61beta
VRHGAGALPSSGDQSREKGPAMDPNLAIVLLILVVVLVLVRLARRSA